MPESQKTAIVTGASRGIGAGLVATLSQRGYCVVANSRNITEGNPFPASTKLALVAGDIADPSTAARITDAAVSRFGGIDVLVNNAGINLRKDFTDYTIEDLRSVVFVNIEGFLLPSRSSRSSRCWPRRPGGSIVNITASTVEPPDRRSSFPGGPYA